MKKPTKKEATIERREKHETVLERTTRELTAAMEFLALAGIPKDAEALFRLCSIQEVMLRNGLKKLTPIKLADAYMRMFQANPIWQAMAVVKTRRASRKPDNGPSLASPSRPRGKR